MIVFSTVYPPDRKWLLSSVNTKLKESNFLYVLCLWLLLYSLLFNLEHYSVLFAVEVSRAAVHIIYLPTFIY